MDLVSRILDMAPRPAGKPERFDLFHRDLKEYPELTFRDHQVMLNIPFNGLAGYSHLLCLPRSPFQRDDRSGTGERGPSGLLSVFPVSQLW